MGGFGNNGGGGAGIGIRCGGFGLVLLLSSYLSFLPAASGLYTVHCVQFGQTSRYGPWSIGGRRLQPRDHETLRDLPNKADWAGNHLSFRDFRLDEKTCQDGGWDLRTKKNDARPVLFVDFCPTDVEVRPYLVKQNGRVLNGWLHIEVEYTNPDDEMEFVYVQVRDEHMNAIGDFVTDPAEQCTRADTNVLIQPSKYQYLPCSAIGAREAKASQGILVARRNQYDYQDTAIKTQADREEYLAKKELRKGIQFLWRLNEYWCNRHRRIRIDAYTWTSKRAITFGKSLGKVNNTQGECARLSSNNDCRLKRKSTDWLHHKWIGAADIKIHGSLTCDTLAMKDQKDGGGLTPEAIADSWFYKSTPLKYKDDYLAEEHVDYVPDLKGIAGEYVQKGCMVNPIPTNDVTNKTAIEQVVTFGGRCEDHLMKTASRDFLPECNINDNSDDQGINDVRSSFLKYTTYRNLVVETRKEICEMVCIYPTKADVLDIKNLKSNFVNLTLRKNPVSFDIVKKVRLQDRLDSTWQTRKYHGNLFIFVAMFIIPVSNFFIRYYKETWMNQMAGGCTYWYWFHLFMSFVVPTLYYSAHASMHVNIANFGKSTSPHATVHRIVGQMFVWIYMAMAALGAIRPAPRRALLVCNTLHAICGFMLYFMCIFLVINSTFIPLSPSLDDCDKVSGLPIGYSFTAGMVTAWFCFDLVCHILLTVAQVVIDRQEQIKRSGFGLPFMPMMPGDHPNDLVGHRFRKLIFVIYVTVSVIFTITLITVLFNRDEWPEHCKIGEMTCNQSEYRPNQKSGSPFGCAPTALKYYALVYNKYDINVTQVLTAGT